MFTSGGPHDDGDRHGLLVNLTMPGCLEFAQAWGLRILSDQNRYDDGMLSGRPLGRSQPPQRCTRSEPGGNRTSSRMSSPPAAAMGLCYNRPCGDVSPSMVLKRKPKWIGDILSALEEIDHVLDIFPVTHVAAVTAERVYLGAGTEDVFQEGQVLRRQNQVVFVAHHDDFWSGP